jgi:hypothetical protein
VPPLGIERTLRNLGGRNGHMGRGCHAHCPSNGPQEDNMYGSPCHHWKSNEEMGRGCHHCPFDGPRRRKRAWQPMPPTFKTPKKTINIKKIKKKPSKRPAKGYIKTNERANRHDQQNQKIKSNDHKTSKTKQWRKFKGKQRKLDSIYVRGTLSSWLYLSHRVFLQLVLTRPRIYVGGDMDIGLYFLY